MYFIGASSGIGKSTAIAFAKEGANVAIAGRNKKRLADVAEECSKAEVEVRYWQKEVGLFRTTLELIIQNIRRPFQVLQLLGDLLEITSLEKIISKTVEKFGAIDILVNNAGTGTTGPVEQVITLLYNDRHKYICIYGRQVCGFWSGGLNM